MQTATKLSAGKVYVIEAVGLNRYKIGFTSRSVEERLKELQPVKQCVQYKVIHQTAFREDAYQLEQYLHKAFIHSRFQGEWFDLSQDQLLLLKLMMNREFLKSYTRKLQNYLNKALPLFKEWESDLIEVTPIVTYTYQSNRFWVSVQGSCYGDGLNSPDLQDVYLLSGALLLEKDQLLEFPKLLTPDIPKYVHNRFVTNQLLNFLLIKIYEFDKALGVSLPKELPMLDGQLVNPHTLLK